MFANNYGQSVWLDCVLKANDLLAVIFQSFSENLQLKNMAQVSLDQLDKDQIKSVSWDIKNTVKFIKINGKLFITVSGLFIELQQIIRSLL